jgi:hypothetical protein
MGKVATKPEKPYSKPTLTQYGTIRELTGTVGRNQAADGGSLQNFTKTAI